MKKIILVFALSLVTNSAFAGSVLNKTNFIRLDQNVNEITIYIPDGHCTVQIISNISPLYDNIHSSSPVGPALQKALEISVGEISFLKKRLTVDISKAHHGGYGSLVQIRTKNGKPLREVISEIIPDEAEEESNVILTLIGNDNEERRCSFN